MLDRLLSRLTGRAESPSQAAAVPRPAAAPGVEPITLRVLMIVHDPVVPEQGGHRLSQVMGWYDPETLAADYIRDVRAASHGRLEHEIVERIDKDAFPVKKDGFCYDVPAFLRCWRAQRGFHQPDAVDYEALLCEFDAVDRINAGQADEVWLFGPPYTGYYESIMVGPRATWCNAPPLERPHGSPRCHRRFVVMGFNYEREVGCMLEDLGHRAESMLAQVYAGHTGERNLWERFTRYDKIAPRRASAGNVHFAPNSERDYDWGNPRPVLSDCDDWLTFPHLTGERRLVDCRDWGGGDMRRHHLWWFERLPHAAGETDGIANNWWTYIGDVNRVP
ncbi:MAG: hypothetical protein HY332_10280 [Chloroflexi bacterium]|nr:hypothetical protein [Chloroflexota bacterium]